MAPTGATLSRKKRSPKAWSTGGTSCRTSQMTQAADPLTTCPQQDRAMG